ncbi:hypothetical protein SESBI_30281 [Sesbania bispinosa]|nr:hypothetical protein SESBI_30281 [Sesbania bispinosa]
MAFNQHGGGDARQRMVALFVIEERIMWSYECHTVNPLLCTIATAISVFKIQINFKPEQQNK